jgi:Leucine-rich repeat (LRR) protein
MSFRQEMVRRKLLAHRIQETEASKTIMISATPLVKVQSKALPSQKTVPLLQKIKEGRDLDDLSSLMDIRLLKNANNKEVLPRTAENYPAIAESPLYVASYTETHMNSIPRASVRLKSMQDLLEVFPEKSCEEVLYDCIPQLLLPQSSKDSANFFQRNHENTRTADMFRFADIHAQYPAEKQSMESFLKSASESGSVHNDSLASIPLKTSKASQLMSFDMNFEDQSATALESQEQASLALQPALSRLLSMDPESILNIARFEAIEQHHWWCAASRCSVLSKLNLRQIDEENSSFECDELESQDETLHEESPSINSSNQLAAEMHSDETETPGLHVGQKKIKDRIVQEPLSPEEIIQEGIVAHLYENACTLLCTPIIGWLHRHPFINIVNVSHMSLRNNGISSLAVVIMNSSKIELLDVFNNGISHVGVKHLCSSLLESKTIREVRLDCNPLGLKGAIQLSGALCCNRLNTSIEMLSLTGCKLGDAGCAAIFKSLLGVKSIKSLNLSLNGAEIETAKAAADVLPLINVLERLSLRWNNFRCSSAVVFCQGAMNNRSVTDLNISCNAFGEVPAVSHLGEALKVMNHLKFLDVSYNQIDGRGAYILSSALEINHHICNCNFSGNPVGRLGARILSQLVMASGSEQASKKGRKIKLEHCNIEHVDLSLFDPSKTSGRYQLDLSDNYSRIVIGSILRMRDLNQGEIREGSIKINGLSVSKLTWKEDTIPPNGFLQFQFESFHHFPPKSEDYLSSKQVSSINDILSPCADEKQRLLLFAMLTGNDDYFNFDQVREIMEMFHDPANKVALVLLILFQIMPSYHGLILSNALTLYDVESPIVKGISTSVRNFTILNPTGHYRLTLDCEDDRRLMDLLLKVRSDVRQKRQVCFAVHMQFFNRNNVEWCILNTKWNGKELKVLPGWLPPIQGVLEFDFTANLLPCKTPIAHDDFCIQMGDCACDEERYKLLRHVSNSFSFRTETALRFLDSVSTRHILEDCIITLYDSIFEIPGFQYVLSRFGPSCRDNVIQSLGIHNCWLKGCAISYYVLDLYDAGHRFVCQQMLALSRVEPGGVMVDVYYENKAFTIPVHWHDAIPHHGVCTFFFSREQAIVDEYYSSFGQRALDQTLWKAFQPAGTNWLHARKRENIKDRIKEKFPNPETAFQTMDRDGGGSLSRVELSTELRKLGIWLQVIYNRRYFFVWLSQQSSLTA